MKGNSQLKDEIPHFSMHAPRNGGGKVWGMPLLGVTEPFGGVMKKGSWQDRKGHEQGGTRIVSEP